MASLDRSETRESRPHHGLTNESWDKLVSTGSQRSWTGVFATKVPLPCLASSKRSSISISIACGIVIASGYPH